MVKITIRVVQLFLLASLVACTAKSTMTLVDGTGTAPKLPPPQVSLIPLVDIAPAMGWQVGELPLAAAGLVVNAFAHGLDHPRWLNVLPNGDVLVAETNAPPDSSAIKGIKGALLVADDVGNTVWRVSSRQ